MKSRTNFFKCLWISAISGRSSENSRMQSDAYSSSFLRKTTAESCDQEGWMVSGSRVLLLFIAWRPAGGADWPYQLCRLHLYQEGQLLLAFPLQLCWFGSFMIWAEQKHYLNMLAIRINIDFNSWMVLTLTQRVLENKYWTLRILQVSNDWCTGEYDSAHHNLERPAH